MLFKFVRFLLINYFSESEHVRQSDTLGRKSVN